MEAIKISLEVNVNLSESTMNFLTNFLKSFIRQTQQRGLASEDPAPTKPTPAPAKPAPAPTKPTPAPAKPAPAKPAPAPTPAKPATQEASSGSKSIEEVRALLVTKVNDHRAAIKQKLEELGAPSVSKLDPSKYDEMFNFLNEL